MKKGKKGMIFFLALIAVFIVIIVVTILFLLKKGKSQDELTNSRSGYDDVGVNREGEETIDRDGLSLDGISVDYRLPEDFYFQDETVEEACDAKNYFNTNYSVMLDVFLYCNHKEDSALIDTEHPENSVINQGKEMDADAWLEEMQMVYLERVDDSDITVTTLFDRQVRYFTKYSQNDYEQMQGTLVAVIKLGEDYYYCVRAVEFGADTEPSIRQYENVFHIEYENEK